MKKKFMSVLMATALVAALLAGCGSEAEGTAETTAPAAETSEEVTEEASEETSEETTEVSADSSEAKPLDGVHLKMAINAEYAPFESVNETGEIVGFDVELNEILAEKLGYTFELDNMDFTGLVPAIQSGRDDYCISALSANEERDAVVDFTDGYYTPVTAILVPAGSDIQSVADLKGKKIGVSLGTEFEQYAKSIEGAEVTSFESMPGTVQLIGTDQLDCEIMDSSNAFAYVDASNGTLEYRIVKTSEAEGYFHPYSMVFPEGSDYVAIFNEAVAELVADGTMEELQAKWFGAEYTDALSSAE